MTPTPVSEANTPQESGCVSDTAPFPILVVNTGKPAAFCKRALAGEPLVVYGDGTQTRDFVFVEDLSRGIAAAVADGRKGVVAHLASGTETTVLEVARLVAERLGGVSIEHRPARVGDVARSASDISTARELFGFTPRVTLRDGLDRTVDWFRESDS